MTCIAQISVQVGSKLVLVNTGHALSCVDAFNPATAVSGNQGPAQMMGMGMSGRGGAMGPEASTNMGAPLIQDNGNMVTYQCSLFATYCVVK